MLQSLKDEYCYPHAEQRKSARYEFSAAIEIEWRSKKYWRRARNISRHGMFIELPDMPVLNAAFAANVALNEPLRLECVVRRIVPGQGIAVTVEVPSQESRVRYEALLKALALGSKSGNVFEEPEPYDLCIADGI